MQYGEVDLNLLLVLERVLARESVTDAATDLGLSPSATSRALQRLRDALGDPLLVRAGNRLVPTPRARDLLDPAASAVEAARRVFRPAEPFVPSTATGDFVLGLTPELQQALLPPIFARIHAVAPGVDLRVRELTMHSAEEGRRDVVHLAIAPDLRVLDLPKLPDTNDLVHQPLYERRFVVLGGRTEWPQPPDLDAYLDAEHVLMSNDGAGWGFVDDLLAAQGLTRRVACTVTSFAAVAEMVVRTRLLSVVPAEIGPILGDAVLAHPPPLPVPTMAMQLVWHPRHTTQPRHRALRTLVTDAVRDHLADPLGSAADVRQT